MVFSALPYTPHEIENAMHPYELPPVHYTVVRAGKSPDGCRRRRQLGRADASGISVADGQNHAVFLCMERRGEHRSIITGSLQYSDPDLKAGCLALAPTARVPISCEHSMLFAGLQVAAFVGHAERNAKLHRIFHTVKQIGGGTCDGSVF